MKRYKAKEEVDIYTLRQKLVERSNNSYTDEQIVKAIQITLDKCDNKFLDMIEEILWIRYSKRVVWE